MQNVDEHRKMQPCHEKLGHSLIQKRKREGLQNTLGPQRLLGPKGHHERNGRGWDKSQL